MSLEHPSSERSWRGGERPDRRPSIAPLFYRGVWAGLLSTERFPFIRWNPAAAFWARFSALARAAFSCPSATFSAATCCSAHVLVSRARSCSSMAAWCSASTVFLARSSAVCVRCCSVMSSTRVSAKCAWRMACCRWTAICSNGALLYTHIPTQIMLPTITPNKVRGHTSSSMCHPVVMPV